ncbi:MAG: hypothetical protein CBE33_02025 [Candidatus Pelagibacter sp. TMED273]|nr:MAG: hypothetical protein CBE33_02025 [Candidatus Pelagibacter sp. TMED273]
MNKFKKFKFLIIDFRFYIFDLITILLSSIMNLIVYRKLYDNKVSIVTASDQHFAETLFQLLDNLHEFKYKYFQRIIVYNLGMKIDQINFLKINFPDIIIQDFNFNKYPDFISKRDTHGTLGAYAWKPNMIYETLEKYKSKVIWLDSANLIDKKFIYVLIVLQSKKFFSPMSAGKINDYTYVDTLEKLNYPTSKIQKRNLTGGFNGFDWNDKKSRFIAKMWRDLSNQEELILPKKSTKDNHRWDQSLLTVLIYKYNYFGYIPKIKKIFGIKVNQNPNQNYFLFRKENDDFQDNLYYQWFKNYKNKSTKTIRYSKLIWLLDISMLTKIPKKYLTQKIVVCNIYKNQQFVDNKYVDTYFNFSDTKLDTNKQVINVRIDFDTSSYLKLLEDILEG